MYIDALCAAALAAELTDSLGGARVQQVIQLDRLTHGLELYRGERRWLLLSADPRRPGLSLGEDKARRGTGGASPLQQALHARLVGARLREVSWPAWERMLVLRFQAAEELRLVAELQGKLANLVLLAADDRILAAARTVDAETSRSRQTLPGRSYQPPPPPAGKLPPDQLDVLSLGGWLAAAAELPAWRVLVDRLRGISPLAAREAAQRACGDAEAVAREVDAAVLAGALSALLAPLKDGAWEPGLATAGEDGSGAALAYAPYRLTHLPGWRPTATLTAAMAAWEAGRSAADAYAAARREVEDLLEEARARAARQLESLAREAPDAGEAERLRMWADLLLAYQRQVPAGAAEALLPGMEGEVRVPLDPGQDALGNAERYYERARRLGRALRDFPERCAEVEARLATLAQWRSDLDLAESRPEIDAVHEGLRASGLLGRPLKARMGSGPAPSRPLELRSSAGLTVIVGRNSRQNEAVTFQRGVRGDLWLHARGRPGAHVLIKSAGREVDEQTLQEAAGLALWFSGARGEARGDVICTDVRHVNRMKGGGPGMVQVREERNVQAAPLDPRELGAAER